MDVGELARELAKQPVEKLPKGFEAIQSRQKGPPMQENPPYSILFKRKREALSGETPTESCYMMTFKATQRSVSSSSSSSDRSESEGGSSAAPRDAEKNLAERRPANRTNQEAHESGNHLIGEISSKLSHKMSASGGRPAEPVKSNHVATKATSYDIEYSNLFLKAVFENRLQVDDSIKLSKKSIKEIEALYKLASVEKLDTGRMHELEVTNKALIDAQMAAFQHRETQDEVSQCILELQALLNVHRDGLRDKLCSLAFKISKKAHIVNP